MVPQLTPGEALMACSDGVWHYFTPEELASTIAMLSPREACEFLIQKARTRAKGAGDNGTVGRCAATGGKDAGDTRRIQARDV